MEQFNQISEEPDVAILDVQSRGEDTHLKERNLILSAAKNTPSFDLQIAKQHPLKILLAEDSMVNVKIALWFLKKLGYHADVVFNGIEAVDALNRRSYDVILMDAEMPEMDGRQATTIIRKALPSKQQPRIIAMTANSADGDREGFLSIGMDDYLSKPLKIEELIRALLISNSISSRNEENTEINGEEKVFRVAC
jgi:CheY-like chemotaxis protein